MSGTDNSPGVPDADERWSPPLGPVDPEHPECAAVIAEVWTLLDG
ncbi:mycothiol system anti-sigma-R factor, partial [Mycobacterium sp. ITM-2017-0098]